MIKCYIPARSGSKGLVDKNILPLMGLPLLSYTIKAALNSGLFDLDSIIVSTDSPKYAEVAKQYGVNVMMRNPSLAQDNSSTYDLLSSLLIADETVDDFILLQPTSPFRTEKHIIEALDIYKKTSANALISITKLDKPSNLLTTLNKDHQIIDIIGIDQGYTRQRIESKPLFYPNGAIFISNRTSYLKSKSFYLTTTQTYLMDSHSSVDIDTIEDFEYAEYLIKKRK